MIISTSDCLLMLSNVVILRKPTESEMSISSQVKESINEAAKHLRDALAFAARSEHPMTISTISELLVRLESIEQMDEILEKYGKMQGPVGS